MPLSPACIDGDPLREGAYPCNSRLAIFSISFHKRLRAERSRLSLAVGESSLVDRGLGTLKLFHDPSESRNIPEDHPLHGYVIPLNHRA